MAGLLTSLLDEPAVADPPRRVWRDWVIVGIAVPTVIVEAVVNENATWRPFSTIVVMAIVVSLLWRRTHPLAVMAFGFGTTTAVTLVASVVNGEPFEYYSAAFILLAPYALFRWGSGRHAAIGLVIMLVALVAGNVTDWNGIGEAVGGTLVLLFPAALGMEVRQVVTARQRALEQAKVREREVLARELHDTVAHHVSAIVIRAQAGRVVGSSDPDAALDALHVIEQEASRTLAEMRGIVGSLRGADAADYAPQPGVDDIRRLADEPPVPGNERNVRVHVAVDDELGEIGTSVSAALYRLAQEAVTNARRHARNATVVSIDVTADGPCVRLTVDDDGSKPPSVGGTEAGFGLVGMTERAHLLGGTLTAGPRGNGGWRVEATIPRQAVST